MKEALSLYIIGMGIFAGAGQVLLALMCYLRMGLELPEAPRRQTNLTLFLLGSVLLSAGSDRLISAVLGGVSYYFATHEHVVNPLTLTVAAARTGLAVFVWVVVVYGLGTWPGDKKENSADK